MSAAAPFSLAQCTARIVAEPHDEYPRALKNIYVEAVHPQEGSVGFLEALQINRQRCRGEFLIIMDNESQELCDFAQTMFDKDGRIRPELVDNEHLKGTGVWGRELNEGMLLYVVSVRVKNASLQRKGIASFLLKELADSQFAPPGSFLVSWPSPEVSTVTVGLDEWQRLKTVAVSLFRQNGYRRVGRTYLLAYATDETHAARSLAIADDVEEYVSQFDQRQATGAGMETSGGPADQWEPGPEYSANPFDDPTCPIHLLIAAGRPGLGIPVPDAAQRISDAYRRDASSVRQKDEHGYTPLHLAAQFDNLPAVQALLSLPPESGIIDDLTFRGNRDALTPLEACQREMRSTKEFAETLLGTWAGYSTNALRIVYLLRRAAGEDLQEAEGEFVVSRRLGCTCGQCTDGWLSPRMRYRLIWTAQVNADNMMMESMDARRGEKLHYAAGTEHLSKAIQENGVSKTFYKGYEAVVRAIAKTLQTPGLAGLPTVDNINRALTGDAYAFIGNAGAGIINALDYVVHAAMEQSPMGDGTWDAELQEEHGDAGEYAALRECALDIDFARVAERLGLPSQERFRGQGRVYQNGFSDDSDDMDDDSDENDSMED